MNKPKTNDAELIAESIRFGLKYLGNGNAMTSMGAIEGHAVAIKDSAEIIANAIHDLADAIRESKDQE